MRKTKNEIQTYWLAQHDALGKQKDAEDEDLFIQQHRGVWRNCRLELQARKADLVAEATLTPEEQKELAELEYMFPSPPEPTPEQIRVKKLLSKSPRDITKEEMWEVIRILSKGRGG